MVPHLGQGAAQAIEDGLHACSILEGANNRRPKAVEGLRKSEARADEPDTNYGARKW